MLGKGLVRVRGRSDDGQVVRWISGECQGKPGERQVNFRWSLNSLNQGKVRVLWGSGEGQMMVRWSGEHQVNVRWISIWAWLCWTWNLFNTVLEICPGLYKFYGPKVQWVMILHSSPKVPTFHLFVDLITPKMCQVCQNIFRDHILKV